MRLVSQRTTSRNTRHTHSHIRTHTHTRTPWKWKWCVLFRECGFAIVLWKRVRCSAEIRLVRSRGWVRVRVLARAILRVGGGRR
jgi:hypothetical protein